MSTLLAAETKTGAADELWAEPTPTGDAVLGATPSTPTDPDHDLLARHGAAPEEHDSTGDSR